MMIEDSKTLLFYLFGLAGLITLSILFTGRIEPSAIEPLPTATLLSIKVTPSPSQVESKTCSTGQQITAGYLPDLTHPQDHRLFISGAVYASDAVTPLPGVQLKLWRAITRDQGDPRFPPYYTLRRTNQAGQYEFIVYQRDQIGQLYYQVHYQNECLLGLQLIFVDESTQAHPSGTSFPRMKSVPPAPPPTSSAMPTELKLAQGKVGGVLLRGPIDIVLPVPVVEGKTTTN